MNIMRKSHKLMEEKGGGNFSHKKNSHKMEEEWFGVILLLKVKVCHIGALEREHVGAGVLGNIQHILGRISALRITPCPNISLLSSNSWLVLSTEFTIIPTVIIVCCRGSIRGMFLLFKLS